MKGTRWKNVVRNCAGSLHRELKITFSGMPNPEKWVFIVGCYNSGTTLLRKILGSHPLVSALPSEGQYLTDQFPSDHEIGLSRMWVLREDIYRLNENDLAVDSDRIKREWGMRLDKTKPVFVEQTPANSARVRWFQKNFENTFFIGVVRNGYAVAEGIRRKARPIHSKHGWSIEQAAYQWTRSNELLMEDSRHLNNFIWLKYEDLTENPQNEINNVLEFLGMQEQGGIDINQNWLVHERDQKIRNMNGDSIGSLDKVEIEKITRISEKALKTFGYDVIKLQE